MNLLGLISFFLLSSVCTTSTATATAKVALAFAFAFPGLSQAASSSSSEIKLGEPHSTVQALTATTFHPALNDPANGLWILKFYAPWCGHCKKLAPTLDAMASYLTGRIAIGKIDCTSNAAEKELCQQFHVRGYPTLKIYRDGDFFDYGGKRDADSMIDFAERMAQNPVVLVQSYEEFMDQMSLLPDANANANANAKAATNAKTMGSDTGVAFLAFDARGVEKEISSTSGSGNSGTSAEELSSVQKFLASTTTLQVFGQVARKTQDRASFAMLHPSTSREELEKFGFSNADIDMAMGVDTDVGTTSTSRSAPILAKIEYDVDPVLYRAKKGENKGEDKGKDENENGEDEGDNDIITSMDFMDFVKQNNVALVTDLQRRNFRTVAHLDKPLFIGVLDAMSTDATVMSSNEEFVSRLRLVAKHYAANVNGNENGIGNGEDGDGGDDYKFATMDGKKWSNFLKQFSITTNELPQFLVLDVPKRRFYQNSTITDIDAFIAGMKDGTIVEREQVSNSDGGFLEMLHALFVNYMPFSLVGVVAVFCLILYFALAEDEDEVLYQKEIVRIQEERRRRILNDLDDKAKAKATNKTLKED